ncbi:helix-turn-helix domain-containing protein [Cellulomonas sp. P5_C5]
MSTVHPAPAAPAGHLLSVGEAALYLGICKATVRKEVHLGYLRCVQLGTSRNAKMLFRRSAPDAFVAAAEQRTARRFAA